jgi:tRNA1Val (adenine37-N6)-methyltransferase
MPNSYFQFKKFIVQQDACAMKVCTDACIFGAWFAEKIPSYSLILDIGSGTGILMLMLAQKNKAEIHGIEIALSCYKQLKENINSNDWKDRMTVFPGDVRQHSFQDQYDFIIANPPFFENDLPSASKNKNIAKHSKQLTLAELIKIIAVNLKPAGTFGVLLPEERSPYFEDLAFVQGFYLREKLLIRQTPKHPFFRAVLHFSRNKNELTSVYELIIKNESGNYTPEFSELMRDYYL